MNATDEALALLARAERAERELEQLKATLAKSTETMIKMSETSQDAMGKARSLWLRLAIIDGACAQMRLALLEAQYVLSHDHQRSLASVEEALLLDAGWDYVHNDAVKPLVEALKGALVICQCYADTKENPAALLDNNDNVFRIQDALAYAKSKGIA